MIFVDFNNFTSIKYSTATRIVLTELKIDKKQWKKTGELPKLDHKFYNMLKKAFLNLTINELKPIINRFSKDYGNVVIARDFDKSNYWRKELYSPYKANRDKESDEFDSLIGKFNFEHKNELLSFLASNFMVLEGLTVPFRKNINASIEADDIIGVLVSVLPGKHLIVSNDGDFHQSLIKDNVKIYHPIERKIINKTKKEINDKNIRECLVGQTKDNIPSIKYNSEISEDFIKWMNEKYQIEITQDMIFVLIKKYKNYIDEYEKEKALEDIELIKTGKRKLKRNLSAFAKPNFAAETCEKWLKEYTLDEILDMNIIYKARYQLNEQLYLFSKIPEEIRNCCISSFQQIQENFVPSTMEQQSFFLKYGIQF